jgi:hypothetical protein
MRGDVYYMSFTQDRLRCPETNITDSFEFTQAKDIFFLQKFTRKCQCLDHSGLTLAYL